MSEKTELAVDLWSRVGLTLREAFRFGFGGLAVILASYFLYPEETAKYCQDVGAAMTIGTALGVGSLVYAAYRPVVLELVLQRLTYGVHSFFDWMLSRYAWWGSGQGKKVTSSLKHLRNLGVKRRDVFFAWRAVRDHFLETQRPDHMRQIRQAHDQIVYLHIVGVVCLCIAIALSLDLLPTPVRFASPVGWSIGSALFFVFGILSDINVDKGVLDLIQECDTKGEVNKLLQQLLYIQPPSNGESVCGRPDR